MSNSVTQDQTNLVLSLYQRSETVFSFSEIVQLFPQFKPANLRRRLSYYVDQGQLLRVRRGIYAQANFEIKEAANLIYTPSYISLETVLFEQGLIFQPSHDLSLASYVTRRVQVQVEQTQKSLKKTHPQLHDQIKQADKTKSKCEKTKDKKSKKDKVVPQLTFSYRQFKASILTNCQGIEINSYAQANVNRAFTDTVYLCPDYHFDNLRPLDWNQVRSLAKIYDNQAMIQRIERYYQIYQEQHV
jgi:hypothetical protein